MRHPAAGVSPAGQFPDHYGVVSLVHSDDRGCAEFINGDSANDDPLTIGSVGTYSRWITN